jgi:hypothetical protein
MPLDRTTPTDRSSLAEVRNPILALASSKKLLDLSPEAREAMRDLLKELAIVSRDKANKSWAAGKGPIASYWRAVSVYAGHIVKVLNRSLRRETKPRRRCSAETFDQNTRV